MTTDRGKNSSAWTTTAKRSPCCSRPTPLGSRNRWTSPRSTKCFHQFSNRQHLLAIRFIGFKGRHLGREFLTAAAVSDLAQKRGPNGLGLGEACGLERAQSLVSFVVQPDRYRSGHGTNVSRFVSHRAPTSGAWEYAATGAVSAESAWIFDLTPSLKEPLCRARTARDDPLSVSHVHLSPRPSRKGKSLGVAALRGGKYVHTGSDHGRGHQRGRQCADLCRTGSSDTSDNIEGVAKQSSSYPSPEILARRPTQRGGRADTNREVPYPHRAQQQRHRCTHNVRLPAQEHLR
jgi:hypothetical protein